MRHQSYNDRKVCDLCGVTLLVKQFNMHQVHCRKRTPEQRRQAAARQPAVFKGDIRELIGLARQLGLNKAVDTHNTAVITAANQLYQRVLAKQARAKADAEAAELRRIIAEARQKLQALRQTPPPTIPTEGLDQ